MKRKSELISNTIWKFAESSCGQIVTFIVSLFLARLVSPHEYGVVNLVYIYITILSVFVNFGINSALINDNCVGKKEYSTAFIINLILGVILQTVLFLSAPFLANLYKDDQLISIIRVLSFCIPIYSIKSILHAYISRTMQFKMFFWATLFGTILSGCVGIVSAFLGYGVWALVLQIMINLVVDTTVLIILIKPRPIVSFSYVKAIEYIKYGGQILLAQLVISLFDEARGLIIGKKYSSDNLSYYAKGKQIPMIVENNIDLSIASVMFVSFSRKKSEHDELKALYRQSIRIATYITFPMLMGLLAIANGLTIILYTEKWSGCISFMRIMCLAFMLYGVDSITVALMKSVEMVKEVLLTEIIHKITMVIIILCTLKYSIYALVMTETLTYPFHLLILIIWLKRKDMYSIKELITDILPNIISAGIMMIIVLIIGKNISNLYMRVIIQVAVGIITYLIISSYVCKDSFLYVKEYLKGKK